MQAAGVQLGLVDEQQNQQAGEGLVVEQQPTAETQQGVHAGTGWSAETSQTNLVSCSYW